MNGIDECGDVNHTVGPASPTNSDLTYTWAYRRHGLPLTRIYALLHVIQFMAGLPAHVLGEIAQSIEGVPVKRDRPERHESHYITTYINSQARPRQAWATPPSSERPAQKFRAGETVAPGHLRRLGDADARPDQDLDRTFPRAQGKRRPVERKAIMLPRDAERLGEPPRSRAEQAIRLYPAPGSHGHQSRARLECPDQNRAGDALALADEIDAPVHPIGAVDIGVAGRTEHRCVARRASAETVGRGVLVIISLDLDDPAADAVHEQLRPDQIRGHVVDASRKKGAAKAGGLCWVHTQPRKAVPYAIRVFIGPAPVARRPRGNPGFFRRSRPANLVQPERMV